MSKKNSYKKKTKKKSYTPSKSTLITFVIGVLLLTVSTYYIQIIEKNTLSFNSIPSSTANILSRPIKIIIPRENISLSVTDAAIINNQWQVNPSGASHLASSANPGSKGNIIIYGHNKDELFGNIRNLLPSDVVDIFTLDNKEHEYVVSETQIVDPSDVKILYPTKQEQLTLYTCDGFADLQRFVVIAYPGI